jgi:alpha-galactosidase
VSSIVNLFASWGIDFIKLDAVTPGSYSDGTSIDNRPDVAAWAKAIAQNPHPIWFTISWALDEDYLSTWQTYANGRRIEGDVECEGNFSTLTDWNLRDHSTPRWGLKHFPSRRSDCSRPVRASCAADRRRL